MLRTLPTVQIADPDNKGDYLVINARDFDPEKHERFESAQEKAEGDDLTRIKGIGPATAKQLAELGITALAALAAADAAEVAEKVAGKADDVEGWQKQAAEIVEGKGGS